MKKLISTFLLALLVLLALPQHVAAQSLPQIGPSNMEPHGPGLIRKAPGCSTGDTCTGSNPPIFQLTVDMCGTVISTSANKNTDGSTSTDGYRYNLPTAAMFAAAGYTSAGQTMASGYANRSGHCTFGFVDGVAGSAVGFVRIGIDGVQANDKITFIAEGVAHDMAYGDIPIPAASGPVYVTWNGLSWFVLSGAPAIVERFGYGQMAAHGQGRLFLVTADPSWWTVGTKVGSLAYCPVQGNGLNINSNGINALAIMPANCAFLDTSAGSLLYWIQIRQFQSFTATGIAEGAAYGASTAADGTSYAAGSYIVLTGASTVNFVSGDTVSVHNMPTTLGSVTTGKWIGKLLTAPTTGCSTGTCIELHEKITSAKSPITAANGSIGPPSSFVSSDTLRSDYTGTIAAGGYTALVSASVSGGSVTRFTNPVSGAEFDSTNGRTIVGLARTVSTSFVSSGTSMYVASAFNAMEASVVGSYSTSRTITSTTSAEISSLGRANFVVYQGSSNKAMSLGDTARGVRWTATVSASNDTNGDGCQFEASFDGGAVETQVGKFVNPAGSNGAQYSVTFSGSKKGLAELSSPHYITLFGKAITGGTCTIDQTATSITAFPWQ